MTPTSSPEFTGIIRDFLRALRAKVAAMTTDDNVEEVVERIFAAGAAIAAGILMAVPKTRNHGVWISSLMALAIRLFTRKDHHGRLGTKEAQDPDHLHGER